MSSSAGVTRKGPVQSETPSDRDTLVDSQDELHMATADSNSTVVGSPEQNVRRARWDMETRGAKRKRLGEEANSAFQGTIPLPHLPFSLSSSPFLLTQVRGLASRVPARPLLSIKHTNQLSYVWTNRYLLLVSSKKPTGLKLTFRFSSSGRKPARETAKGRSG